MTYRELQKKAKEFGIKSFGVKKAELEKLVFDKENPVIPSPIKSDKSKKIKIKLPEVKPEINYKSDEEVKRILNKKPDLEVKKVVKSIEITDAHQTRNKPINDNDKERLNKKYVENFVTIGRLRTFLDRGYRIAELNENSGFSLSNDTRYIFLREARRSVLIYVVKEK